MTFEDQFRGWVASRTERIPSEVRAICFNLAEPAFVEGVKFSIEIVGCDRFDLNDPDWPCDEIWWPDRSALHLPSSYSSEDWETCLARMIDLVRCIVATEQGSKLLSLEGIGIGFVDGDLHHIHPDLETNT